MLQALKTLCLIQFWSWMNSLFPLLALWGNKNWPPSMKVKKLKIFWNKMGSMGCKGSSLNTPGTENSLCHSILKLDESPFPIWGNKNWPPSIKFKKLKTFWNKNGLNGLQMVQFECPRHWKLSASSTFGVGRTPFSHYWPSGVIDKRNKAKPIFRRWVYFTLLAYRRKVLKKKL